MVRLWISAVHQFFPINAHSYISKPKFLSTKHQFLSLLKHCSSTNHLFEIHAQILVSGRQNDSFLTTELLRVAALSPSRNLSYGCSLLFHCHFHSATLPWNLIIRGYSSSDSPREAISLFGEMRRRGVIPNNLTFPFLLKACATLATLQEGRAGQVKEAYELIMSMPVEPDPVVWRTLLSACSGRDVNGGAEVAEEARKRLLELEPKRGGNVVMVANKFAEVGMWKQAADYRRTMKDRGIKKMAGESCIELGGSLRKFFSGFNSRAASDGIYDLLDGLNLHMQLTNF
ncbi:hypothetical protein IC582_001503 [Cucumis melo]